MAARSQLVVLLVSALCLSWLVMMAIHELGHVIGAIVTNGTVLRVVLHPAAISRTDVSPNPSPLTVAWMGPILGCLIPLVISLTIREIQRRSQSAKSDHPPDETAITRLFHNVAPEQPRDRPRELSPPDSFSVVAALLHFFAGFCLLANGAYLGIGVFDRIGDAGEILKGGTPQWMLIAFGLVATMSGLLVWHQLGSPGVLLQYRTGFNPWLTRGLCATTILIVVVECLFSST